MKTKIYLLYLGKRLTTMSADIILQYFKNISDSQINSFFSLWDIYKFWNQKLNLISRSDMDNFYLHHVLHSMSIAKIVEFKSGSRVLDVGTGGGFPGIPMAIFFPNTTFHLIDSVGKKVRAVRNIIDEVGLKNVILEQARAEEVGDQYDFILGRAVTNINTFYNWTKKNISNIENHTIPNGILYMKGPELAISTNTILCKVYDLNLFFEELYFKEKKILHLV
jgi:16S rRNA (guanine527-N7)-methyltransferase